MKQTTITTMILGFLITLGGCQFTTVDPGHVGVATDWGEIQSWTYATGFHVHSIPVDVFELNTQMQAVEFSGDNRISVLSNDRLTMGVDVTVQYALGSGDAVPAMFDEYFTGEQEHYTERCVIPVVRESIRDVISELDAVEAVQRRQELSGHMLNRIQQKVSNILTEAGVPGDGITIIGVQVRNILLPEDLRESIARIQRSQNEAMEREQQIEVARQEAEKNRIQAEGASAVAAIQATQQANVITTRATAEAEANRLLAESLTENLLRREEIRAQMVLARHVSTVVLGGGNMTSIVPIPLPASVVGN